MRAIIVSIVLAVVLLAVAGLVGFAVADSDAEGELPEVTLCEATSNLTTTVEELFDATRDAPVALGDVENYLDAITVDLIRIDEASDGEHADLTDHLRRLVDDLRDDLQALPEGTSFADALPLMQEAVEEMAPYYDQLVAAVEPACTS